MTEVPQVGSFNVKLDIHVDGEHFYNPIILFVADQLRWKSRVIKDNRLPSVCILHALCNQANDSTPSADLQWDGEDVPLVGPRLIDGYHPDDGSKQGDCHPDLLRGERWDR